MLKLQYKAWLSACALLLMPLVAHAAGLGQIKILSSLGQPLRAEIDLSATQEELSSLNVKLASPDAFRQANIEYSPALMGVRFSVEQRADGTSYVKVTSTRSIDDTFIDLLVELNWAQGRLVREYTALIDPPDYTPPVPASAPVPQAQAVEEPAPTTGEAAPQVPTTAPLEQTAPVVAPVVEAPTGSNVEATPVMATTTGTTQVTEVPSTAASEPMPTTPAAVESSTPATTAQTTVQAPKLAEPQTYKVKSGDTLTKIAIATKPDGVTIEQVLVALFQANPDAFSGKNMNRLKAGKILREPTYDEITAIAPDDATKEIRVQAANWNAYRKKIAEAAAVTPAQESQSAASGKIAAVEQAPTARGASKEVVKLSKGEAGTPAERARALQEEVTAKQKALDDANMRIAALEKNVKDMQHLLELKGMAPAPAASTTTPKPKSATPPPVTSASATAASASKPAAASAPVAVPAQQLAVSGSGAVPTAPIAPKKPKVVAPPPSSPSLLSQILGNPLYLAALAVVVLGGGYWWTRRRAAGGGNSFKKKVDKSRADDSAGGDDNDDLKLMNRTVMMPAAAAAPAKTTAAPDNDVDPIAEADLYLNFGRDAQAEEVLKEALKNNPQHEAAQIKLLQIYANRKDKNAFEKAARAYHEQTGARTNWLAVAAMGYALDAANPLYSDGANVDASSLALGAASQDSAMDLDFDLLSSEAAPASDVLDIGGDSGAPSAPEFDIGSDFSGGITDITGGSSGDHEHTTVVVAPDHTLNVSKSDFAALDLGSPSPSASSSNSMDFSPSPMPAAAPVTPSAETHDRGPLIPDFKIDFSDLSSDLGGMTLAGPVAGISGSASGASASASSSDDAGLSFPNIGLSIDVPSDGTMTDIPGTSEVKDAHWFDVQTKFDLAKAYQEMGDKDGARDILQEVVREGDATQKSEAQTLLDTL